MANERYDWQISNLETMYNWRVSAFPKDRSGSDMRRQMRIEMEQGRANALNRINQKYDGYETAIRAEYNEEMRSRGLEY